MIKVYKFNKNKLGDIKYVLCDFDRTISTNESDSTWDLFRKSDLVDPLFKEESDKLFQLYRPIEVSPLIPQEMKAKYMEDWAILQFELLKKYISFSLFNQLINEDIIKLRYDFKEFIELLYEKRIPLYIVSGGIYQPIISALKRNDCFNELIHVTSNKVINNDDKIVGISKPIIHSQNKKDIKLGLNSTDLGLLFGDLPKDIDMGYNLNTINCAFADEENSYLYNKFDFILTENSSFTNISKILIKK